MHAGCLNFLLTSKGKSASPCCYILIERRGKVVVSTSVWHATGRWFDSRTRHVSLIGVKTWLSTGIVYL